VNCSSRIIIRDILLFHIVLVSSWQKRGGCEKGECPSSHVQTFDFLTDSLYDYLLSVSLREPDLLLKLREEPRRIRRPTCRSRRSRAVHGLLARLMGARVPRDRRVHGLFVARHRAGPARRRSHRGLRRQREMDFGRPSLLGAAGVAQKIDLRLATRWIRSIT